MLGAHGAREHWRRQTRRLAPHPISPCLSYVHAATRTCCARKTSVLVCRVGRSLVCWRSYGFMLAVVSYALSYAGAVVSYPILSYRIVSYRIVSYRIVSYPGSVSWRTFHYGFLYVQSAMRDRERRPPRARGAGLAPTPPPPRWGSCQSAGA